VLCRKNHSREKRILLSV